MKAITSIFCLALAVASGAAAADSMYWHVGAQSKSWEEFNDSGEKLLKETGPLLELGLRWSAATPNAFTLTKANLYAGNLDYKGQTWDGEKVDTSSRYTGLQVDYLAQFPIARLLSHASLDLGGGAEAWERRISNYMLNTDQKERYMNLYARAGLGMHLGYLSASAGARYPVWAESTGYGNSANGFSDSKVNLGRRVTPYFSLQLPLTPKSHVEVAYEEYHFGRSNPARVSDDTVVYQPETKIRQISVGVNF